MSLKTYSILAVGVTVLALSGCGGGGSSDGRQTSNRSFQNISGMWDGGDEYMEITPAGEVSYYEYYDYDIDACWAHYGDDTLEFISGNRYLIHESDTDPVELEITLNGDELSFLYEPGTVEAGTWVLERSNETEDTLAPRCDD